VIAANAIGASSERWPENDLKLVPLGPDCFALVHDPELAT